MVLCTYCGSLSISTNKCSNCGGHFDLLSRQRTQNGMGPWFIRDQVNPFHPGCSYDTLRRLVARGRVRHDTVMRGPTTRQFWSFARNTPGVAHLLGACHACHTQVDSTALSCPSCNASFILANDRQQLGLAPMQMLPGDADPSAVADAAFGPVAPAEPLSAITEPPAMPLGDQAAAGASQPGSGVVARPVRKHSSGPMVAVVASVGCAIIALAAVVYLNQADTSPGAAAASETPPARVPSDAATRSEFASSVEEPTQNDDGTDDASQIESVVALEEPVTPVLGEPSDRERQGAPAAVVPSQQESGIDPSEPASPPAAKLGREVVSIGSMSDQELADARAAWLAAGRERLAQAADRRLQQLDLRELFVQE